MDPAAAQRRNGNARWTCSSDVRWRPCWASHLIGTTSLPSLKGVILVLEEVGEAPYRVDRMLTQWRSAGLLQQLAGVACGRFSWTEDDILPGDFTMEEILEERLGDLGIPLVLNLQLSHGRPTRPCAWTRKRNSTAITACSA